MSSTDPFALLGLDRRTATQADVKAAYARLLKVTRPEDDPDGFMALRQAFTAARAIAPAQATPPPDVVTPEPRPTPAAAPSAPQADPAPDRPFDPSPADRLQADVIAWMTAGGPDADAFVAATRDRLQATPDIDKGALRKALIGVIVSASDPKGRLEVQLLWAPFSPTRPDWLTGEMVDALVDLFGLLRVRPEAAHAARDYNIVQEVFAQLRPMDGAGPIDVEALVIAEAQAASPMDDGSFYDPIRRVWVDRSAVGIAVQDFEAAIRRSLWDLPNAAKDILTRDALQPLDEFRKLDARLRQLVVSATRPITPGAPPIYPPWLTPQMVHLLDNTFGWSSQFGRNQAQREEFDWLHRVISRDRSAGGALHGFRPLPQVAPPPLPRVTRGSSQDLLAFISNPKTILLSYLGYRALLVLWRLAS